MDGAGLMDVSAVIDLRISRRTQVFDQVFGDGIENGGGSWSARHRPFPLKCILTPSVHRGSGLKSFDGDVPEGTPGGAAETLDRRRLHWACCMMDSIMTIGSKYIRLLRLV